MGWDFDSYITSFTGGLKSYMFYIPCNQFEGFNQNDDFLVKSTNLPGSSFEEIVIPVNGLSYKMAGAKTYSDWTVTFNVDKDGKILELFYKWHEKIMKNGCISSLPITYMKDSLKVFIVDLETTKKGKGYDFKYVWPKTIGDVSLDYATSDIATLEVTFSYMYYKIIEGDK